MDSGLLDRLSASGTAPLYVVAPDGSGRDALERRLGSAFDRPVVAVRPTDLPTRPTAPAAVVFLPPSTAGGDAADFPAVVEAAADAPVVVVGASVDAAAAYEAGVTDVVPLSPVEHPETVADRVTATVERHLGGQVARGLLAGTGDGVVVHDPDTAEILACNERFYGLLGADPTADDVELSDVAGHDDVDRLVSLVREAAAGTPQQFEWTLPTTDGDTVPVEVGLDRAELAGETYVVASMRDVTGRPADERELAARRTAFQRLSEITADPDATFAEQVDALLGFGTRQFGVSVGFLARTDADAGTFEVIAASGEHPDLHPGSEAPLERTYCRRTIASGTDDPLAIEDAASTMADDPAYERFGLGCYLGTELVVDGERYGTLCFADDAASSFDDADRALLEHMAAWLQQVLERREYVEEVEAARRRLQRTFERVDDAFFAVDGDWHVKYVNEAGAAVLREAMDVDATAEELLDRHLWDAIPDAVDTQFYEQYHRAMRDQESVTFEARYEPMDVWFEVRAYPDEDGLSVYFTDITERKEREVELERYETVLESLDDAVYAIDPDGTIQYANRTYASMKGVDRSAMLGTNIYDWVDDEMAARADTIREELEAGERDIGTLEYDFRTVDGETIPAELRFTTVTDGDGDGIERIGVIRNVTERKERERDLYIRKRAMDEASIPLTISDPNREDNPMVYVNDAFERLTGYDAETAVGRNCRFLQGPETDPETVADIREAVAAEEPLTTEILHYRADGTPFWNRLTITPIYDEDGTLLRYLWSQADVTEERRSRRIRRDLLSTTTELMNAESRDDIADIVSEAALSILDHELNAVYLRAGDDEPLEPVAWSPDVERIGGRPPAPADDGPVATALREGDAVVREDLSAATDVPDCDVPVESVLAVPLGDHGVLGVGASATDAFDGAEIDRARLLTTNAASALDRMDRRVELERYETLFETVRDKLYVVDAEGHFEMVSEPLAEAVGYDPETLRGQHLSTVMTEETVADREALVFDLLVTPESASSTYEGALVSRDGTEFPVEIELSVLPYTDEFRGTVGAVRDISERRQREAELRVFQQAVTEAGVGMAMYGADGTFEYANDHYAQLLGRTGSDLDSLPLWEAFERIDRESFPDYWDSFVAGETRTEESALVRPDRSTVPVETVTTAVEIDGRRHHLLTVREITSRRQRQQQSEVLHRLIRHNLRNDLTVILGHASHLADALDGDRGDSAATIEATAERLRSLTDTAQDAQDIIGRDTVRRPVDVTEMLRDEVATIRETFDVTVETDFRASRSVLADTPLRTALRHLLTNAVEHNDGSSPWLAARTATADDRTDWITIEIADDGPGIPDHEIAVLTAGEETSLHHGSGIGLWVVHWIVTRYGGELEFEERTGGGSVVRIRLPATDRRPEAESTDASADSPGERAE